MGLGPCLTAACCHPGADVVDWLYAHLEGFRERREARKYASSMLKRGFLRHTVNKVTFSEQCYYVFGDLCSSEWGCGVESQKGRPPSSSSLPERTLGTWGGQRPVRGGRAEGGDRGTKGTVQVMRG